LETLPSARGRHDGRHGLRIGGIPFIRTRSESRHRGLCHRQRCGIVANHRPPRATGLRDELTGEAYAVIDGADEVGVLDSSILRTGPSRHSLAISWLARPSNRLLRSAHSAFPCERVRSLALNVGSLRCRKLSGVGGRADTSQKSRERREDPLRKARDCLQPFGQAPRAQSLATQRDRRQSKEGVCTSAGLFTRRHRCSPGRCDTV
jgi:hypothetical protein